jgi:hypothetical protein
VFHGSAQCERSLRGYRHVYTSDLWRPW